MKNQKKLKAYRCPDCQKLLFYGLIKDGIIEIKCKYCKELKTIIEK